MYFAMCDYYFNFNSKKVRLRLNQICRVRYFLYQFQFQKGAIKTGGQSESLKMLTKFQFQKGAIKTIIKELQGGVYPPFQFQKGAIKTNPICLPLIQAEYFNSKKVRLRLCQT